MAQEAEDRELTSCESSVSTSHACNSPKRPRVEKERLKYSGAFKYKTKFNREWTKNWSFIVSVPDDLFCAKCNICAKKFSVAHQGIADVRSHIQSKAHSKLARAVATQPRLAFSSSLPHAEKVLYIVILHTT